jgi:capsular polysaccharide biosynthesis protein
VNQSKNVAKEINLKELFLVLKRRLWLIAALTIIATTIGVVLNNSTTVPLYQASSRIIIGADADSQKTLQVIVRDSIILDKVIEKMKLNKSSDQLAGQITVNSVDGSQVVSISVIDSDPVQAAKIADTTAEIFKEQVPIIVGQDYVRLLSSAKVNSSPINPKNNNKILIAFIGGAVIGIGFAFLLETLDDTIRSKKEIEGKLGLPVLGRVPKVNRRNVKKRMRKFAHDIDLRGETIGTK